MIPNSTFKGSYLHTHSFSLKSGKYEFSHLSCIVVTYLYSLQKLKLAEIEATEQFALSRDLKQTCRRSFT